MAEQRAEATATAEQVCPIATVPPRPHQGGHPGLDEHEYVAALALL
ncbi:hypothetical protein [Kitasatospora sp. NPDC088351]